MGTRADFYIGRGKDARWLGSVAYDGYPGGILDKGGLKNAANEDGFLLRVAGILERRDATAPEQGWPWPWKDSGTTDYAYAFDEGRIWVSCFGGRWKTLEQLPELEEDDGADETKVEFPDMTAIQNVTFGERSGLLLFSNPKEPGQ